MVGIHSKVAVTIPVNLKVDAGKERPIIKGRMESKSSFKHAVSDP